MAVVSRRTGPGRAERRDALLGRLLSALEDLLGEGMSFPEIRVDRLVAHAGVSPSTFYLYFEDKADLLRAWFDSVSAEIDEGTAAWWQSGSPAGPEQMRAAVVAAYAGYRPHAELMAATFDAATYDADLKPIAESFMAANIRSMSNHIVQGQQSGDIDPRLLPEETAEWLSWMTERCVHQTLRHLAEPESERLLDGLARMIWHTLYAPAT